MANTIGLTSIRRLVSYVAHETQTRLGFALTDIEDSQWIDTSRPRQNERQYTDNILAGIFLTTKLCSLLKFPWRLSNRQSVSIGWDDGLRHAIT